MANGHLVRLRKAVNIGVHLALLALAFWIAVNLRFEFDVPEVYRSVMLFTLALVVSVRMFTFAALGLFNGWWRHAGVDDVISIAKAVTVSSVLLIVALFMAGLLPTFPRSVLLLDWLLACGVIAGARLSTRVAREVHVGHRRVTEGTPTLILGAGLAAEQLLRHIRYDPGSDVRPVGLLDDDPERQGMRLHGVPVLGATDELARIAKEKDVQLLVIAVPSASREQLQQLVDRCVKTRIPFKIVPSLRELLDGETRIGQLRSIQIEDLLGRPAVALDLTQVEEDLEGRTILITGGAGSIGSELARQIAAFSPARLILVEQAESNLYFVHLQISEMHPTLEVVPVLADICDERRVNQVFATYRPDYVFHAAAYKHVPLMESNVREAVRNNALGTLCVAENAAEYGARKFVLISTDKAVRPSSVMGATKRIAERIVLGWPALKKSGTDFRAVRFGNVLGSDGSVIPLFKRQIAAGAPLTVTHPDISRYFMTIPEAVQLVLQAAALPEAAGRVSILDMGDPVRILELAENLIRLSGLEPYRDVPIVFSGLRPGEKLHEELTCDGEFSIATSIDKVSVLETAEAEGERIMNGVGRLAASVRLGDAENLLPVLAELVPDYRNPVIGLPLEIGPASDEVRAAAGG